MIGYNLRIAFQWPNRLKRLTRPKMRACAYAQEARA
jgi:hypothetical protein